MPFTPVTYNTGAAPGIDGPAVNAWQLQYLEAINSFEQDLFTPFVYGSTSMVATKDGTTASQLDVTAGVAFPKQTDSTLRRRATTATTFSASGHASSTLYLDLNPDGSWSWGTAHSGVANYLPIASVVTDSSSNIATVTDARTLATTLLSGMAGSLALPKLNTDSGKIITDGAGNLSAGSVTTGTATTGQVLTLNTSGGLSGFGYDGASANVHWDAPQGGGVAHGFYFATYTGSTLVIPLSLGSTVGLSYVDGAGIIHGPSGLFGQMTSAGGGAAGGKVWVGTTDPGASAAEGDIWIGG